MEILRKKIPNTSTLVTTTVLYAKIRKYITKQDFNKLTAETFEAKLKQVNLVNKTNFDNALTCFNKRIT